MKISKKENAVLRSHELVLNDTCEKSRISDVRLCQSFKSIANEED